MEKKGSTYCNKSCVDGFSLNKWHQNIENAKRMICTLLELCSCTIWQNEGEMAVLPSVINDTLAPCNVRFYIQFTGFVMKLKWITTRTNLFKLKMLGFFGFFFRFALLLSVTAITCDLKINDWEYTAVFDIYLDIVQCSVTILWLYTVAHV